MRESEVAYGLLCDLEQTLTGARDRLADLALLLAGAPPLTTVAVPPPEELCAPDVPAPLVLPPEVDAPGVVVPGTDPALTPGAPALEAAGVSAR